jgi:hypothetical protein
MPAVSGVPVIWSEIPRRKTVEAKILGTARERSIQSSVTVICRAPGWRQRAGEFGVVGPTALLVFETARLLRKYPVFNAVFDNGRIGLYGDVNVGWALDGGSGLMVPVVPAADRKSVPEIVATMQQQLERYAENSLTPADFLGGTVTVTDLTSAGIAFMEPLLSQGQSAILGVGAEPDSDTLYLTLAFDHQLSEGRTAALFLQDLAQRIEAHGSVASGGRFCAICGRTAGELVRRKAALLKSTVPEGLICSLCLTGRS